MNANQSESKNQTAKILWLVVPALLLIAVLGGIFYLLSPILTPFVAAAILAYICNPLVSLLAEYKLPRGLAVVLVMLGLLVIAVLLLLILLPLLENELVNVSARLPEENASETAAMPLM